MKSQGIYVEIHVDTSIDKIWQHTQDPILHQQWDLRFTSIDYLPKRTEVEPQRFRYTTAIGFGLRISGEGESTGTVTGASGERSSALKFWSHAPLSLIRNGSGYWKYIPVGDGIKFLTWYDYQVRFGVIGQFVDRLLFRPLIGWATAWSFDALRLWLEQNIHPAQSLRRFLVHATVQITLALIWIYQGLVPKLFFPDSGELAILAASGFFPGVEAQILALIGIGEMLFGLLFLLPVLERTRHYLNIGVLCLLALGAVMSVPAIFSAPFNPATLNLSMIALSVISLLNAKQLPKAAHCIRKANPG